MLLSRKRGIVVLSLFSYHFFILLFGREKKGRRRRRRRRRRLERHVAVLLSKRFDSLKHIQRVGFLVISASAAARFLSARGAHLFLFKPTPPHLPSTRKTDGKKKTRCVVLFFVHFFFGFVNLVRSVVTQFVPIRFFFPRSKSFGLG